MSQTSTREPVVAQSFDFNQMSADEIQQTLAAFKIVLTVEEALKIQNTILQRPPTLSECLLWSIQGSEHCSYKSSRKYLKQFATTAPHVIIGAKEDAGIVSVATDDQGERYGIVVSHESHNHPSQIVPYEGAATGVGGNVRDVLCMGAEVIAVADALRFGEINHAKTQWIREGVVAGIAGYANPLGVPNIAGDVYYHPGYNENCLVTVVTLGIVRESRVIHSYAPAHADGYDLILIGKPTDNSGFGGASFSSLTLEEDQREQNKGAVQEPNAFLERHLLKASYALFDLLHQKNLLTQVGFKDLGAGGIACASVELAEAGGYGAELDLDLVHTSISSLHPSVILCAETQERFMWVAHPEVTPLILEHYNTTFALPTISAGAQATVVGKIRRDRRYIVRYRGEEIVNALAHDVVAGIVYDRPVQPPVRGGVEPDISAPQDYNHTLLKLLAHENIASRRPIIEMYDKQVQGRTHLEAGTADAGVIVPFNDASFPQKIRRVGVALTTDQNPRFCEIDPYQGAINAVVESVRNVVATGCTPVALTDCLCFGNPEKPTQMWDFVESVRGINDASRALGNDTPIPIIAGNVSLYNESKKGAIPPSPMISCLGKIDDYRCAVDSSFKAAGSVICLIGERRDECGGSVYYQLHEKLGAKLPIPDLAQVKREIAVVLEAIDQGLVLACHDISEGGLAVALAEMSFKQAIGIDVAVATSLRADKALFSESGGFVLELIIDYQEAMEALLCRHQVHYQIIGRTTDDKTLRISNGGICVSVVDARQAWEQGLRDKLL